MGINRSRVCTVVAFFQNSRILRSQNLLYDNAQNFKYKKNYNKEDIDAVYADAIHSGCSFAVFIFISFFPEKG